MGYRQTALGQPLVRVASLELTTKTADAQLAQAKRTRLDWRGWLGLGMLGCAGLLIWRKR
ncbi:MAG: hypothetical protein GX886_10575 [Comamonadaceae bacterium]|jgi:hypothetical protein|nr:hypothetical protein [Comamonadaceae bacterium]